MLKFAQHFNAYLKPKNERCKGEKGMEDENKAVLTTITVVGVKVFSDDDESYHEWLTKHPQGFVVNTS